MKCSNVDKNSCTYIVQAGRHVLQHPSKIKLEPNYKTNVAVIETLLELAPFLVSKGIYKNKIQNPKNRSKTEAYLGE